MYVLILPNPPDKASGWCRDTAEVQAWAVIRGLRRGAMTAVVGTAVACAVLSPVMVVVGTAG